MGGKKQTVTNKAEPWGPAQGYLKNAFGQASDLYGSGAFAPVPMGLASMQRARRPRQRRLSRSRRLGLHKGQASLVVFSEVSWT